MFIGNDAEEAEGVYEEEEVDLSGNVFDDGVEEEVSTGGAGDEGKKDMPQIVSGGKNHKRFDNPMRDLMIRKKVRREKTID